MEIRNHTMLSQSTPVFQAKVEQNLAHELRIETSEISTKMLDLVEDQFGRICKWGDKNSQISASVNLDDGTRSLALFNDKLSSSYGAELPQRGNILSSFLNLRKQDILKAEQKIEETVSNNKLDLVAKAIQDEALMTKIAGKANATDEELAAAIDKLSEEEITNLRFGLDERPVETGNLLDFVV